MTVITAIATWSLLALGALLLVAQLSAYELGYRVGRRQRGIKEGDGVGVIVGSLLGLLGFVLAVTLSFATTRFDERRAGSLAEANAIGTAWLRAVAIGHPRGSEVARLLEDYAETRLAFIRGKADAAAIDKINQRTGALQTTIWGHVSAIVREQPTPIANSLMTALNDTFDMSTSERFAYELRLPPQVFWLLTGLALLGMGALGVQLGIKGQPLRPMVVLLIGVWTVVIVNILDLASPRIGTLRTGTAVYEWTLQSFQGGMPIPPLPEPRR